MLRGRTKTIQFNKLVKLKICCNCLIAFLSSFASLAIADTLTLEQILSLVNEHNPALASADASKNQAIGALTTARQFPNPDFEFGGGGGTGLGPGALNGQVQQIYLSQALDLPFVREARRLVAEAGITSSEQAKQAVWLLIRAKTQQAFYEILRREAELQVTLDNEHLLEQIRDKITIKVEVGEAASYEAVKAEAELLNAIKLRTSATIMVTDAKSALRALFADALPKHFDIQGELPSPPNHLPNLNQLEDSLLTRQPLLQQAYAEVEKALAKLEWEQRLRYPQPILKAGTEHDPGLEQWRIAVSVPLPIWNQRQGPIAEAQAGLQHAEAEAAQQKLNLMRELQNAYNRYSIADQQVHIFETGLLRQAQKALQVAEAAYRLGARGILDYLDAQRSFRSVSNDYINARFDREYALIDLERLNAEELK